jgi:chorismate mutase
MLQKFRKEIDQIDSQLVRLLHKRKKLVEKIGLFKKKQGLPIFNKTREAEINKKLDKLAKKYGLRKTFLQKVWAMITTEAKMVQKKIKK